MEISIHAPAKGATCVIFTSVKASQISIHAPAKGATRSRRARRVMESDFNPRSREGSDTLAQCAHIGQTDFNPRSREGSDPFLLSKDPQYEISIHAPAKGATVWYMRL